MKPVAIDPLLVRKYNQPVPRYTSYPTVPYWKDLLDAGTWERAFRSSFEEQNHRDGISLYIHLPFCESLCTYCGCNKKITTNHSVEGGYIDALKKEWTLYRRFMKQAPLIREMHLGGGTPTFFSPKNLENLIQFLLKDGIVHPGHEFSIEGHPNNTTKEHLQTLSRLRFRRISYGVQDNDPRVQALINRLQPLQNLERATVQAREAGFTSVNYDLIYGLPLQTPESISRTIDEVIQLRPDRIAFYSYAHVPWTSRGQRLFDEHDLPSAEEKLQLYLRGKELLTEAGYSDIGMDHFALPTDDLYKARENGKLNRNFMGYTSRSGGLLLGLGVSAISDTGNAYAQNEKNLHRYYERVDAGNLPLAKGYFLDDEDLVFRRHLRDLSCKGYAGLNPEEERLLGETSRQLLEQLQADGLINWNEGVIRLTGQGHYFIRNVCSALDLHLARTHMDRPRFSKAI